MKKLLCFSLICALVCVFAFPALAGGSDNPGVTSAAPSGAVLVVVVVLGILGLLP